MDFSTETGKKSQSKTDAVPWRNGEDAGLVYQGSAVRAPPQEIFHSNSGLLSYNKSERVLRTIAKRYFYYS